MQNEVLSAAADRGLAVSAVQYRGTPEAWSLPAVQEGQVLWRQRLAMPVEGRYPALHAWLAHLLAQRALALDALQIERQEPGSDRVKARVEISLYWRQPWSPGR